MSITFKVDLRGVFRYNMARDRLSPPNRPSAVDISSTSTMISVSGNSSSSGLDNKRQEQLEKDIIDSEVDIETVPQETTNFENEFHEPTNATYSSIALRSKAPLKEKLRTYFGSGGKLRPFRLLKQDIRNVRKRYISDWTLFNQLVFASAVYVFFTNILPGITFASDLYVRTGMNWGTIEVVFSTGLCGVIFSL